MSAIIVIKVNSDSTVAVAALGEKIQRENPLVTSHDYSTELWDDECFDYMNLIPK